MSPKIISSQTHTRNSKNKMFEEFEIYKNILDSMGALVYIASFDYKLEFMNQDLIKRSLPNYKEKKCYKIIFNLDKPCKWCKNKQLLQGVEDEWELENPVDNHIYEVRDHKIFYPNKAPSRMGVLFDITKKKDMELVLDHYHADLEEKLIERDHQWLRKIELEQLINEVSNKLNMVQSNDLDIEIQLTLKSISEFFAMERSFIYLYNPAEPYFNLRFNWVARPEFTIQKENFTLDLKKHQILKEFMENPHTYIIRDVQNEPDSQKLSQIINPLYDLKSAIYIPMYYQNAFYGILGLDSQGSIKQWQIDEITSLETITEILMNTIARQEDHLRVIKSLRDKEILLKEIHHRVKNNLQIVSGLVFLQLNCTEDNQIKSLLNETYNRIQSMSTIHEILYQSDDIQQIDFNLYIDRLSSSLLFGYGKQDQIKLDVQISESFFDLNQAIPIGLIINEIVSNSIKHAFPDSFLHFQSKYFQPTISISLKKQEGMYILNLDDNGIGFVEKKKIGNDNSLGFELIELLIEQLDAQINRTEINGVHYSIKFILD